MDWVNSNNITSLDDIGKAEQWLHKQTFFFHKGSISSEYQNLFEYEAGAKRLNEFWKDPSCWFVPLNFVEINIGGKFSGTYKIPIYAFLNEKLNEFIVNGGVRSKIKQLRDDKTIQALRKELSNIKDEIELKCSEFQRKEIQKLIGCLQRYIRKRAVKVKKYEPHYSGSENGRDTHEMLELVENARLAFRGVVCGNEFAYDWLMIEYIDSKKLEKLQSCTNEIVDLTKRYLAFRVAIKYKDGIGNPILTEYEIEYFKELIEKFNSLPNTQAINSFLKSSIDNYNPNPNMNYFWGANLSKKRIGTVFEQIYKVKFDKKMEADSFRKHKIMENLNS